jgi:hypothetical protein
MAPRKRKIELHFGPPEKLTRAELGRFLKTLAAIYRHRRFGNAVLSEALDGLAFHVLRGDVRELGRGAAETTRSGPGGNVARLKSLGPRDVIRFLADEKKSKPELAQLAAIRFAIPKDKLRQMPPVGIRKMIRAALVRERRGLKGPT